MTWKLVGNSSLRIENLDYFSIPSVFGCDAEFYFITWVLGHVSKGE